MRVNTYLNFGGNCEEAFCYYEKHMGAKIASIMRFKDIGPSPQNIPAEAANGVLHGRLELGDTVIMASDVPPNMKWEPMRSAYISLQVDSNAEAERIYNALAEGGQIFMPMAETFFAHRFGQLRDRFGVNWMVVHQKPMA